MILILQNFSKKYLHKKYTTKMQIINESKEISLWSKIFWPLFYQSGTEDPFIEQCQLFLDKMDSFWYNFTIFWLDFTECRQFGEILSADNSNQHFFIDYEIQLVRIPFLQKIYSYFKFWHYFHDNFFNFSLFLDVTDFELIFSIFKAIFWGNG